MLKVYLHNDLVGTLEQDDRGQLLFTYISEWLEMGSAIPLSRMLPLQPERFEGTPVRHFFAGVLPEDEPRRVIASRLGISEGNDFALLEVLGGECAGAVRLLPEDAPPLPEGNQLKQLTESELEQIIAGLPRRPLMAGEDGLRLSLAGAQDKLPVVIKGQTVALPLGNTPSTHIIKPEPDRFPGLAANELFCMRLAKAAGLKVANASMRIIGGKACILVERYDRISDQGCVHRLHQEDFCQALGFPPERKYQQEGGPLLKDCIKLLREWSTTPVVDIRDFVDALIYNVLIGNADAHGKNFSMLYHVSQRGLAPLYDLVCTASWPELSKRLAMNIGNAKLISEVLPDHFRKFAEDAGLGWPMIRERISALSERVDEILSNGRFIEDSFDKTVTEKIASFVLERVKRMNSTITGS